MTQVKKKAQMGTLFHTGRQKSGAQVSTKFGAQMSSCNSGKKAQMSCALIHINLTYFLICVHFNAKINARALIIDFRAPSQPRALFSMTGNY